MTYDATQTAAAQTAPAADSHTARVARRLSLSHAGNARVAILELDGAQIRNVGRIHGGTVFALFGADGTRDRFGTWIVSSIADAAAIAAAVSSSLASHAR